MADIMEELEQELNNLPRGTITEKKIKGKSYFYLQWKEKGKTHSQYIKRAELAETEAKVSYRRLLQEKLSVFKVKEEQARYGNKYFLKVTKGKALQKLIASANYPERRSCFASLEEFLYGNKTPRICSIYGLRRTGKTTLLFQLLANMTEENFAKAVYIKARKTDTMSMLDKDLNLLYQEGYRFIFIDEITFIEDFVDTASLLADIYAGMGMKIIISGTDSLGLWLANKEELYDRAYMLHTTWVPFNEHVRLLGTKDIDDYICYGGTLRAGETDFDSTELRSEDISFGDDESTRRYIDTAICKNIQHSLRNYENGTRFMHLEELYEAGELTNAINRIIESMNHRFVLSVLQKNFKSNDLRLAKKNLLKERNLKNRTDILERIDAKAVTDRLKEILEILEPDELKVTHSNAHVKEIKLYLKALDLIESCPIRYYDVEAEEGENVLIMQPGLRYCQAQALVHSLMKDKLFADLGEDERQYVKDKLLNEVKGRMMEEIVLIESKKLLPSSYEVFKYQFIGGEFDMVIYDKTTNTCKLFEIKHSKEAVKEQCRHLLQEEACSLLERNIATIAGRYVIYRGSALHTSWGVEYLNVADYLCGLKNKK